MRRILAFLAGLAICAALVPQLTWAQEVAWDRTFGGADYDEAYSVQQTSDGGYILTGVTDSYGAGGHDVWLIKTDSEGGKLWHCTFGGSEVDRARCVQQTLDGGYILAGGTYSSGAGSKDAWLIKTDSEGQKLWDRTFGGSDGDHATSVQQTSDGGYILAGATDSYGAGSKDAWLIKTDSEGLKLWDRTFSGADDDGAYSVQQTSDGGYILAGGTGSYGAGGFDAWLIKTDSEGQKLWHCTFGGSDYDEACSVHQTSDGGYILAGMTYSSGAGWADVWLIKTDSEGQKIWDRTFGGTGWDWASSVQQISDGGYILAGVTSSLGAGLYDVWLIRTDSGGQKLWDRTFGGAYSDIASSVQQTSDGGYILAGGTWYGDGAQCLPDDVWLIKIVEGEPVSVTISVLQDTAPQSFALFQNYPNPFNAGTLIRYVLPTPADVTISVYNLNGQVVRTLVHERVEAGCHAVWWDGADETGREVASGVYLYQVVAGRNYLTKKTALIR